MEFHPGGESEDPSRPASETPRPQGFRSLASKFFVFTASLVFWVVAVIMSYDLRNDRFDVAKGVLLCVVVLLVAGAISRMTTRLLARPLTLLQEGIKSVGEGKLEKIQVSRTGDEVEFVGESFNKMIDTIARTQAELRAQTESLEGRIRQRTEQLEIAMQRAMEANNAKGEFLANISHELRTPMNGVLGMIDMVLQSPLNPEQRDQLETAQRCAFSLLTLLNDLLDLSKIEAGRMILERVNFDLKAVIEDVVRSQAAVADRKGLPVRCVLDRSLPQAVCGDPLRLRQMLGNLVSNAVKFTDTGYVQVYAAQVHSEVPDRIAIRLEVSDTGLGIEEEKLNLIFEKFTQADSSINRRYGGTGLGLAITKVIAEMHQGSVEVRSKAGDGSTFTILVHYDAAPEGWVEKQESTLERRSVRTGSILLVDDNAVNQKLVSSILRKEGYRVEVRSNGEEAIAALHQSPYELVLMDLQMPVLDGLTATRRIRANPRWQHLPIIAMTAHAMEEDREVCIQAGMNGYLSKPVTSTHLLNLVANYCPSPANQRAVAAASDSAPKATD
jgi:signal transduction histidine kinase/CheY-like chemotaxis protein